MLVLSRKQKQQIQIGGQIVLTVLQIKGGSVRLGIEAPREIHVLRGELAPVHDPGEHLENATPPEQPVRSAEIPRILPLGTHTIAQEESITPTRLTEIAKAIPSLHLPR
ncbi:MAG: carbon storage regulator [Planctomycetota bacterium]|nr:carbon storage regulator [Planctomycetota bacterium]